MQRQESLEGCPQLIGAIEARLEGLSARLAQALAKLICSVQ